MDEPISTTHTHICNNYSH